MRHPSYFLSRMRARLGLIAKESRDVAAKRRAKIAIALDHGQTYREIQAGFGCSSALVGRIAAAIERADTGFFAPRRRKRRRSRLQPDLVKKLQRVASDRLRSGKALGMRGLARDLGVPATTLRRYCNRLGLPGRAIEIVAGRPLEGRNRAELFERRYSAPLPLGLYVDGRKSAIAFQLVTHQAVRRSLEPGLVVPEARFEDVLSLTSNEEATAVVPVRDAALGMGPLAAFIEAASARRGPFTRLYVFVTRVGKGRRMELKRLLREVRDARVFITSNHAVWVQAATPVAGGFDAAPPDARGRFGVWELAARNLSRAEGRPFVWLRQPLVWTEGRPHPAMTGDLL